MHLVGPPQMVVVLQNTCQLPTSLSGLCHFLGALPRPLPSWLPPHQPGVLSCRQWDPLELVGASGEGETESSQMRALVRLPGTGRNWLPGDLPPHQDQEAAGSAAALGPACGPSSLGHNPRHRHGALLPASAPGKSAPRASPAGARSVGFAHLTPAGPRFPRWPKGDGRKWKPDDTQSVGRRAKPLGSPGVWVGGRQVRGREGASLCPGPTDRRTL